MTADFDDLFGDDAPEPGAIQKPITLSRAAAGGGFDDVGGISTLLRPVTKRTLATVFGIHPQTLERYLVGCPTVGERGNRKLYDFKEAASYIVKPKMTPKDFVKTLNVTDLPPAINKAFWDAQRSRIRYKLEAQESWDTEDVIAVLGETFMLIKDTLQMATEEVRERARLTDEQAVMFEQFIDELRKELRQKLIDMPKQKQTTSMLDDELFGMGGGAAVQSVDEEWGEPGDDD